VTGRPPSTSISAAELLGGGIDGSGRAIDVFVSPQLLADLHDPRLVIAPDYVGPDRRRPQPPRMGAVRHLDRSVPRRSVDRTPGWRQVLVTVLATVAAVVPLTLIAAHGPAQASVSRPAATTTRHGATTTASVRSGHLAAAVHRRAVRTEARRAEQAAAALRRADRAGRADRIAQRDQARGAQRARTRADRMAARTDRQRGMRLHRSATHAPAAAPTTV
jgi:hypothetical protein